MFKIYLRYMMKYRFWYLSYNISNVFQACVGNLSPLFFKFFIETLEKKNFDNLYIPIVFIIVVMLLQVVFNFVGNTLFSRLYSWVARDLKRDVMINLQDQDYEYHTSKSSGKLISTVKRGDDALGRLLDTLNSRLLRGLISFVIPLVFIFIFSWKVGAVILFLVVAFLPLIFVVLKNNITIRKQVWDPEGEVTNVIVDNLANFETVKSFAREKSEEKRLVKSLNIFNKINIKYIDSFRPLDIVIFTLNIFIIISSILICINEYRSGSLSLANFVVVICYVFGYTGVIFEFFYNFRDIAKSMTDFIQFFELVQLKPTIKDIENPIKIENPLGQIELKNVSFGYGKKHTIDDVNLVIKAGQDIALVGASGAGKSTITKLLLRYYDANKGEILIDGVNIKNISQNDLRNLIGIVPQDPIMFNNTIAFNVGYAIDEPSQEQIESACRLAQIHDFVETLPEKYETVVGERGIKLSGGQRQRLAIARMILKNPKILIFDEATSALDSESEKLIQKAFVEVTKDKTTIIIAHRLSTIINCDNLFVFDEGKLIESGRHEELVNREGIYKRLWDIQSGFFDRS